MSLAHRHRARVDPLDLSAFAVWLGAHDPVRTGELDPLLAQASIADLQDHMASGRLSSEELTLHLLGRPRLDPPAP